MREKDKDMEKIIAAFQTLGCKTNHYETDAIRMQFQNAGFETVSFSQDADVYVLNTCTVTGEADRKTKQYLRRAKNNHPKAVLVALGCAVELGNGHNGIDIQLGTFRKKEALSEVIDYIVKSKPDLAKKLRKDLVDKTRSEQRLKSADWFGTENTEDRQSSAKAGHLTDSALTSAYDEWGSVDRQNETRAHIKIEDGCDYACSYCAIPLARGSVRSRLPHYILAEAAALAKAGYKEIVLTGIHICSYGRDWQKPGEHLMRLALDLSEIAGIDRIRLGSLEPRFISDEWINLAKKNKKLCPHFHLSLQSGSDTVLARMNRRYDTGTYARVVTLLRQSFDDPALTTDIITGFPGETKQEHEDSLAFCKSLGFSRMHVFKYSRRSGTAAAAMSGQVAPQVISQRSREMGDLARKMMTEYHQRQIGKHLRIILEKQVSEHIYTGYSDQYIPVRVNVSDTCKPGSLVTAKAARIDENCVICGNAICLNP